MPHSRVSSKGNSTELKEIPADTPGKEFREDDRPSSSSTRKNEDKVCINVGGVHHETYRSTLKNIPDTRLAWLAQSDAKNTDKYDQMDGEFFFDRHPGVFQAILNYYRTGKLHCPNDVCGPLFEEELEWWGLDEKQIEACCWSNYTQHRDAQETLLNLNGPDWEKSDTDDEDEMKERQRAKAMFGVTDPENGEHKRTWAEKWNKWQPKIWKLLDKPYTSRWATFLAFLSLLFVVISITTFCLETVSTFQTNLTDFDEASNTTIVVEANKPVDALLYVEGICVAWFTLELIVRFIFCPNKCSFVKSIENIVDFIAIVPFYVDVICRASGVIVSGTWNDILSFIRIVRIFRIFKLTRHFNGLKILMHTLKASAKELLLLIVFLFLGILIFASIVYYAEKWLQSPGQKNDFTNIPVGFWWAVVTMTTVGYGDMVPRTATGMLIGSLCAIAGVLMVALPVPIIVNNFALYYTQAEAMRKLPPKKKRVMIGANPALKTQLSVLNSLSGGGGNTTTSSTELIDGGDDNTSASLTSEDSGFKTGANGQTGLTVTFIDENNDSVSAASLGLPHKPPGRRSSFIPNGIGRRESFVPPENGRNNNGNIGRSTSLYVKAPSRRRSLLPSHLGTMSEVDI